MSRLHIEISDSEIAFDFIAVIYKTQEILQFAVAI